MEMVDTRRLMADTNYLVNLWTALYLSWGMADFSTLKVTLAMFILETPVKAADKDNFHHYWHLQDHKSIKKCRRLQGTELKTRSNSSMFSRKQSISRRNRAEKVTLGNNLNAIRSIVSKTG